MLVWLRKYMLRQACSQEWPKGPDSDSLISCVFKWSGNEYLEDYFYLAQIMIMIKVTVNALPLVKAWPVYRIS